MEEGGFLSIAVVIRPHGVKGKIQVRYLGDTPDFFTTLNEIRIGRNPENLQSYRVQRIQPHKGLFVLELVDFSLEDAERSKGCLLWVERDELPPLDEGEYYWEDLIGLRVMTDEGEDLGEVRSILETGSNEVLVCGSGESEVLLPFIEDVVLEIDVNNGIIRVRIPEGLR